MIFNSHMGDCHCGGSCDSCSAPAGGAAGYGAYGAYGGAWESWCSETFVGNPEIIAKCNSKPSSICPIGICLPWAAPWTEVGARERGIPGPAEVQAVQAKARAAATARVLGVAAEKESNLTTFALLAAGAGALLLAGGALIRRRRAAPAMGRAR